MADHLFSFFQSMAEVSGFENLASITGLGKGGWFEKPMKGGKLVALTVRYGTPEPSKTGYYLARYRVHWKGSSPRWGKWELDDTDGYAGNTADPIDMVQCMIVKALRDPPLHPDASGVLALGVGELREAALVRLHRAAHLRLQHAPKVVVHQDLQLPQVERHEAGEAHAERSSSA